MKLGEVFVVEVLNGRKKLAKARSLSGAVGGKRRAREKGTLFTPFDKACLLLRCMFERSRRGGGKMLSREQRDEQTKLISMTSR